MGASTESHGGLSVHEVTPDRWPDFERLFESRGGPKSCWCMVWRGSREEKADKASRKAAMRSRVRDGTPVGLLGYLDGEPVAWCSVAPRPTLRYLGVDPEPGEDSARVWSIVCFFVKREHRGAGMLTRLLDDAVRHATAHGAQVVEAYPVDADSPSYRFMGFVRAFEEAGFHEVGRVGKRRHVVRKEV